MTNQADKREDYSSYVQSLERLCDKVCQDCGGKLFYSPEDTVYIHWPSLSYFCDKDRNPTGYAKPK